MAGPELNKPNAVAGSDARVAAIGAAATLLSGRGMNRSDRDARMLVDAVLDLAEKLVPWIATGRRETYE